MDNKTLAWKTLNSHQVFDARIYTIDGIVREASNGFSREFYAIQSQDWAVTIPLLKENNKEYFVLVKQFRHGLGEITIEFPSGIVEKDEAPVLAAQREMQEETGFKCSKITELSSVSPNAALFSNRVHTFVAENLENTGSLMLDEAERIEVVVEEVSTVIAKMGTAPFNGGAIMNNALLWYLRYQNSIKTY